MPFPLSPQSIDAISEIISGGSANDPNPPIGIYRTGPKIEKFMRTCNVAFSVGGSRVSSLVECLNGINSGPDAEIIITKIIELASDPRDFISDPGRYESVLDYLNRILRLDGYELRFVGGRTRLFEFGMASPVIAQLGRVSENLDFDTVSRDLDRAMNSCDQDPEDAITAACSVIECVCRSIIVELGEELPSKKDIQSLYNSVKRPLGLSLDRPDLDPLIADDVRKVLSGLATTVNGVGALRTHGGDAHGRERGYSRVDARIARLSIHAASTVSLFLIETWQRKFPTRLLPKVSDS